MYQPTWITPQLAAGYAPMSYEDLDTIREQGIVAIVNLCGEFTDLHQIEEDAGFEVYYLPVADESAPTMEEMERALEWLDEAIYLRKKVLVHCRHGHGRTGTLISAYLVRKGLGLKKAEKMLKNTRANPTNYSQWKLLKKYHKQEGRLAAATPNVTPPDSRELEPFLEEYERILLKMEEECGLDDEQSLCGGKESSCCREYFTIPLVEAIYLQQRMNRRLSRDARGQAIERAMEYLGVVKTVRTLHKRYPLLAGEKFTELFRAVDTFCPLSSGGHCLLPEDRPFRCRIWNAGVAAEKEKEYEELLANLSRDIFLALTGAFPPEEVLRFSMADMVSGRFVQRCFQAMNRRIGR